MNAKKLGIPWCPGSVEQTLSVLVENVIRGDKNRLAAVIRSLEAGGISF